MKKLIVVCMMPLIAACGEGSAGCGPAPVEPLAADHPLVNPESVAMQMEPPDSFDVRLATSQGPVTLRIHRAWSPLGAQRVYNLARHGYFDGSRFYRVLPGFVAQFGMSASPAANRTWNERPLVDETPRALNRAGTVAFAQAGADSRTAQLFINYRHNEALDLEGFTPVGRVTDGMPVLYRLYSDYGETAPAGRGPDFGCMISHGTDYLERRYPRLDVIDSVTVETAVPDAP